MSDDVNTFEECLEKLVKDAEEKKNLVEYN